MPLPEAPAVQPIGFKAEVISPQGAWLSGLSVDQIRACAHWNHNQGRSAATLATRLRCDAQADKLFDVANELERLPRRRSAA